MINKIKFTKMQGAGNDYIYVNTLAYPLEQPEKLAVKWSAPHTGIGSDGLVLISPSPVADFSMRIFNADGSEAAMCGNASRCIGKYVYEKGLTDKKIITLETPAGIKTLQLHVAGGRVEEVTVEMGQPRIGKIALEIEAGGHAYTGTVVSMGNPHLVIFVETLDQIDLAAEGPLLETHPLFPDRTNVEFVEVLSSREIRMRVWERGSGITQACGTGASASAVAAVVKGKTGRVVKVNMDGGTLTIRWDRDTGQVYMRGGATEVFEGSISLSGHTWPADKAAPQQKRDKTATRKTT